MNGRWFEEKIQPSLKGCNFEYSEFIDGDFGDLERIELKGLNKLATVEFWSKGWIGIDVYDCALDEQVMNVLLSPEEKDAAYQVFESLIKLLTRSTWCSRNRKAKESIPSPFRSHFMRLNQHPPQQQPQRLERMLQPIRPLIPLGNPERLLRQTPIDQRSQRLRVGDHALVHEIVDQPLHGFDAIPLRFRST